MCGCEPGATASARLPCQPCSLLLAFQDVRSSYKFLTIAVGAAQASARKEYQKYKDNGLQRPGCNDTGGARRQTVAKPRTSGDRNDEQGSANVKRRDFLMLGAAATATGAFRGPAAFAQAKMVRKATDVHPTGYPTVEAVEHMGKKLDAATQGRISI